MGTFGLTVFNLLYWPYLLATCVLFFAPAALIFAVTRPIPRTRPWLHRYTNWWAGHYLAWAPYAGVAVRGREHVPSTTACIFIANHQSMVDILAVHAAGLSFLWVSKIENFFVPFLGWNMALNGYVPLRRGYFPSILRMVRRCLRQIGLGRSLFIFPEGTRSPTGELMDFYPGAFRLAARQGVPFVPLVIEGTQRVLPKQRLRIDPQPVEARFLEPIHPQDHGNDWRRLRDVARERMASELARIRGARDVSS